jgi:flavin-binding protein dodecin
MRLWLALTYGEQTMSIAKVIEVTSNSTKSFDDAIQQGIARASKTVEGIKEAWIQEQTVKVERNKVSEYRVHMKITFVVKG